MKLKSSLWLRILSLNCPSERVCVRVGWRARARVCVCVCVRARAYVYVFWVGCGSGGVECACTHTTHTLLQPDKYVPSTK